MSDEIELEVCTVHFATEPVTCADAIVCQRNVTTPRGLSVRLSYGDGHQLAHELQGQETPRSQSIALMRDVLECLGGRVAFACLHWDGAGVLRGGLQVDLPNRCVQFAVSPGHALAVTARLGVALRGDEQLFAQPASATAPAGGDASIDQFLNSLDFSGLGA